MTRLRAWTLDRWYALRYWRMVRSRAYRLDLWPVP